MNCLYCKQDYTKQTGCNCTIPVKTKEELKFRIERNINNYKLQTKHATPERGIWLESEIQKLETMMEGI